MIGGIHSDPMREIRKQLEESELQLLNEKMSEIHDYIAAQYSWLTGISAIMPKRPLLPYNEDYRTMASPFWATFEPSLSLADATHRIEVLSVQVQSVQNEVERFKEKNAHMFEWYEEEKQRITKESTAAKARLVEIQKGMKSWQT